MAGITGMGAGLRGYYVVSLASVSCFTTHPFRFMTARIDAVGDSGQRRSVLSLWWPWFIFQSVDEDVMMLKPCYQRPPVGVTFQKTPKSEQLEQI